MIVFTEVAEPAAGKAAGRPPKHAARSARLAELEQELLQVRGRRAPPTKRCRPRRRNSGPPTRSCNPRTRNCSPPRGADHLEGGDAVDQRGAADGQRRAASQGGRASRASSDMKNLLNSTDIATLFLDSDLNVRRFTRRRRRSSSSFRPTWAGPSPTWPRRWFTRSWPTMRRRSSGPVLGGETDPDARRPLVHGADHALPDAGQRIDGVVITFADITVAKTLEAKLRENQSILEKHVAEQSKNLDLANGATPAKTAARTPARPAPGKPRGPAEFLEAPCPNRQTAWIKPFACAAAPKPAGARHRPSSPTRTEPTPNGCSMSSRSTRSSWKCRMRSSSARTSRWSGARPVHRAL